MGKKTDSQKEIAPPEKNQAGLFFITDALAVSASESFRSCKLADILESNTEPDFSGTWHGGDAFS
jgi:hypothetical protein